METKNKRAAVEKSIEYLGEFSKNIIPKSQKIVKQVHENELPDNPPKMNEVFLFRKEEDTEEIKQFSERLYKLGALDVLNELEFFSAAMVHGLADEEVTYTPIVKPYTSVVAFLYPAICTYRKNDLNAYTNVMELFKIWNGRLQKENLELAKQQLDQDISSIPNIQIKSIGVK
ncbi:hypothetical protein MM326_13560 [Alkalihalobacillus sp. LMS6]|uniref:DUF4760 domain-containing protein n=1 Tax=Alkalihalobacillus sp. LMS6 TaxID=2924034 RepID=UPI0020D1AEDD|nr:hypothetical protein [Alkalihalobacillus sp. LMS6]UTR05135.1 hypothetical protein MM326_13560 [Alkalihalobacillus sp. LMS6]